CLALAASYLPTLLYYRRNPLAALVLPVVATMYLAMTWFSALRALAGTRSSWKGRRYRTEARSEK
ncbi:MAG TPA: glycosyl transferase, partial [Gammaproteobacteria bacterium]|nr:glycosyl transferase [Gammaproteobacteria bacterium]